MSRRSPAQKRIMKEAKELSEPTDQYAAAPLEVSTHNPTHQITPHTHTRSAAACEGLHTARAFRRIFLPGCTQHSALVVGACAHYLSFHSSRSEWSEEQEAEEGRGSGGRHTT